MTFNVTFVFQIIHFLIAYWLLSRFFFRHIFLYIDAKDMHQDTKKHEIMEKKRRNELLSEKMRRDWHERHQELQRMIPLIEKPSSIPDEQPVILGTLEGGDMQHAS